MVKGSEGIRNGSVAEGLVLLLEDFFGHGCRCDDYSGYTAKLETHHGAINFGKVSQGFMGFVSKV